MDDPRIEAARRKAHLLYEGVATPHRSCGIAIAETFGLYARPYQAFRRGGFLGDGPCGSIQAGLFVLGELLGDPDPTGPVTPTALAAAEDYRERWREVLFGGRPDPDTVCDHLTAPHGEFDSGERRAFCTGLAAEVAALVAEVALRHGAEFSIEPVAG